MGAARASAHALEMTTRSTAVTVAGRHGPARSHPAPPSRGQSTASSSPHRGLPCAPCTPTISVRDMALHLRVPGCRVEERGHTVPCQALRTRSSGWRTGLPLSRGPPWSTPPPASSTRSPWHRYGPQDPYGRAWKCYDTPSREGRPGGGRIVRPPAGLGRWRAHGDRLPAPRAPAQRRRPRPAARGPATRPWPDSRRPPGAAGRARGGARRTRRVGTPSRPRPQGSLGGSLPLRVYHSRPGANARGARAHQSGAFLPL